MKIKMIVILILMISTVLTYAEQKKTEVITKSDFYCKDNRILMDKGQELIKVDKKGNVYVKGRLLIVNDVEAYEVMKEWQEELKKAR